MSFKAVIIGVAYLSIIAAYRALGAPALVTGDGLEPLPQDTVPIQYRISIAPDDQWTRFAGRAELSFEVRHPTARVIVNALELDIQSAVLENGTPAKIVGDTARQRVVFEFDSDLLPGRHTITTLYSGKINDSVSGLFKVRVPNRQDKPRDLLFTSLCCIATPRRLAPLWDQPDLKATFEIDLLIPSALTAVSNMPVTRREPTEDGRSRVQFAATPPMSSYLLFFVVGDFERLSRQVGPTEIGVVLQKGKGASGAFVLDATADSLQAFNDYFDISYPLPKLDSIGMPGVGNYGAMENWGAILYFEPYIAVDAQRATERELQHAYQLVTHEMAHQWFGNLVTMAWWDDLWMNEGFASWMAAKTSDRFHPEWNMWIHASHARQEAMRLDASVVTHSIIRSMKTLEEAQHAFDEITYEKGSQIVRMIESWVGADTFRDAIRAHMRKHSYSNAVTADLLFELDKLSNEPVTPVVRDFTEQPGLPLIEVLETRCSNGKTTTLTLRQSRFGLDSASKERRLWNVPVIAGVAGTNATARKIVRGESPVRLDVPGCGPVKVNFGQTGYFRSQYDAASFDALRSSFHTLSLADQAGLLQDSRALAEGGYNSYAAYFDIADGLPATADPLLLVDYVRMIDEVDALTVNSPEHAQTRAALATRLSRLLARIGWLGHAREPSNTALLRESLIESLARLGDAPTLAEAKRRLDGSTENHALLPTPIRGAIVKAVAAGANADVFADLRARAAQTDDSAEKTLYLMALAGANDPAIVAQAMELSLSGAVPRELTPLMLHAASIRHARQVYDFVVRHYEQIELKLGNARPLLASVVSNAWDAQTREKFSAFMSMLPGESFQEYNRRAESSALQRELRRPRAAAEVSTWLSSKRSINRAPADRSIP